MPLLSRRKRLFSRPHLRLIALVGLIVPRRLRTDWRQEWEAELRYREGMLAGWDRLDWRNKLDLLRRSASAFWDSLRLQPRRLEDEVFQDGRYGVRMMLKHKASTLVVVVTLALGVGANTAIFSVVNGVLLRPLPYRAPERLARLWETNEARGGALEMTSVSNLLDWQRRNRFLEDMAAWQRPGSLTLTSHTPTVELRASVVSANYFSVLGAEAMLGRTFAAEEGLSAQTRVVVISHGLWQSNFITDPQVTSAKIQLEKKDFQIIGVMPSGFTSPAGEADLWLPMNFQPNEIDRGQTYLQAIARLRPQVTFEQAQVELDDIAAGLGRQFPASNRGRGIRLVSLTEQTVGNVRRALLIVFGAVGLVLLIACANVANLFLVRATQRAQEFAIRRAVGASQTRLTRQLLIEAAMIAVTGGALGLVVAIWALELLTALAAGQLPRLNEIGIDRTTLLFTTAMTLSISVLFSLAPALHARRANLNEVLKDGGSRHASGSWRRNRLQRVLVVAQVALALMLLAGAGLLTRSFVRLVNVNPGFHTEGVLVARLFLGQEYRESHRQVTYFRELTSRLRNLPGVAEAGAATVLPMNPFGIDFDVPYHLEGEAEPPRSAASKASFRSVTPEYFQAIGIPLFAGRTFLEQDQRDSPSVIVVNQELAERAWPHESAIGKRLRFSWADWQTYEVVGVVGNTKSYGLTGTFQPELFVPHAQIPYSVMGVVIKTTGDPAAMVGDVQRTIRTLDPYQPPHSIVTMKKLLSDSIGRERFALTWLGALAAIALLLSTVGLYSVLSYVTAQRTHEIGLRIALGAQRRDIFKLAVGQGLMLVLIGIALGLVGAALLTRIMTDLLYDVAATDELTFAGVSTLLLTASVLACYMPARRAMKVDPLVALRNG